MSGIAALWQRDGEGVSRDRLQIMLDAMAHRGAHGRGTWHGGAAALGQLAMRPAPEELCGSQPLTRGNLTLAAAGRIDNRAELVSRLGITAASADVADGELILRAYERWGDGCVNDLLGDFAFALWDDSRRVLFCARAPVGIEPFYHVQTPRFVACASEMRALLALPEVAPRLDELGLAVALVPEIFDAEVTLVRGIRRLPPGEALTLGPQGMQRRRFWAPDPEREIRLPSDAAYAEALREVLFEAVRCRMRTSLPLGTMLSGGLDSSSVTCVARATRGADAGAPLPAVSVLFGEGDERQWIDAVLRGGGLQHVPINWSGAILPDPAADPSPFTSHLIVNRDVFRGAADAGIRVLLGGDGGDQALSFGHLAPRSARALFRAGHWRAGTKALLRPAYRRLRGRAPGDRRRPRTEPLLLHADLAQRLGIEERSAAVVARFRGNSPRAQHAQRLESTFAAGFLEADAALAARHGLDVRSPFWDRRVLEFCLALPVEQKEGRGMPRIVLRRAMEGLLPPEVQWRGGKWSSMTALVQALRQIRKETERPPGMEAPLSALLDTTAVEALWHALDRDDGHGETPMRCWRLAALSAQVRTHGLTA